MPLPIGKLPMPRRVTAILSLPPSGAKVKPGVMDVRSAAVEILLRCSASLENAVRSEEHTSELQSLMRISYAVFCLKKKKMKNNIQVIRLNTAPNNASHRNS